jgi:hypothetical protein
VRRSFNADGERLVSGLCDLWFRNGGRATRGLLASSIKNLRRIESFQLAGKFRGLYLNTNIWGLSTAASQEQTSGSTATES